MAGILVALVSLVIGGCNKPTAEMKRAQAAIDDAKKAGAGEYAAGELASAEQALAGGKKQMDNFQYKKARASFEEAYRLALKAKEIALKGGGPGGDGTTATTTTTTTGGKGAGSHTVVKGDCLWYIAESKDAYSDPFQWPLIYDANRSEIDSAAKASGLPKKAPDGWAHWIFPGQELAVPQDASTDQIKDARMRAGAPAPYLPPGQ
jgi:nucleoid-associated protein YgaU